MKDVDGVMAHRVVRGYLRNSGIRILGAMRSKYLDQVGVSVDFYAPYGQGETRMRLRIIIEGFAELLELLTPEEQIKALSGLSPSILSKATTAAIEREEDAAREKYIAELEAS